MCFPMALTALLCLRRWDTWKPVMPLGRTIKALAQCLVHRAHPSSLTWETEEQMKYMDDDWHYRAPTATPIPGAKERALQGQCMPVLGSFRGRRKTRLLSSRVTERLKSRHALPWGWPRHLVYRQPGRGLWNPLVLPGTASLMWEKRFHIRQDRGRKNNEGW